MTSNILFDRKTPSFQKTSRAPPPPVLFLAPLPPSGRPSPEQRGPDPNGAAEISGFGRSLGGALLGLFFGCLHWGFEAGPSPIGLGHQRLGMDQCNVEPGFNIEEKKR